MRKASEESTTRPRPVAFRREFGQRRCDVDRGERSAVGAQGVALGEAGATEPLEGVEFEVQRPIGGRAILASSSTSSLVVKRIAPAMVWRWMKVALSGGFKSASPCACGVSM